MMFGGILFGKFIVVLLNVVKCFCDGIVKLIEENVGLYLL